GRRSADRVQHRNSHRRHRLRHAVVAAMRRDGWQMRGTLGALGLVLVGGVSSAAAPPVSDEVVVARIFELNKSALQQIEQRKFAKARGFLLDAEGMGKERGGVVAGAVLASTYLQLGAVEAMTGGDPERARRYFRRALCRRPRIRPSGPILDP